MNIGSLLNLSTKMLNSKNIDTARLDSQLILGKVLNKDKIYLIVNSNEEVEEKDKAHFQELLDEMSYVQEVGQ